VQTSDDLKFKEYFKEIVPFTAEPGQKLAHKYTIEITRAVFNRDSFDCFCAYESHIHKKYDKSKSSYTGFLCKNPLYDPRDEDEVKRSPYQGNPDTDREK